jgi:hypothetical protein
MPAPSIIEGRPMNEPLCRNQRVFGSFKRVRCGWQGQHRLRGRICSEPDALIAWSRAETGAGADWAGSRTAVAIAM